MKTGIGQEVTGNSKKAKVLGFALGTLVFALGYSADAQHPAKIPRIGFLAGNREGASVRVIQRGLRDLGYIEGKNILVEYRYMEGKLDLVQTHVAELVQLKVDVLVSPLPQAIIAAKKATKTIPIVMMITSDPVATGIVDSLARPGGGCVRHEATGLYILTSLVH